MKKTVYTFLLSILILTAASCKKIEQLPPEPFIEFRSFEVLDTTDILGNSAKAGRLKFYFEDGDGNIGLNENLENPEVDNTNLFFTLFKKTDGEMVPVPDNYQFKPSPYRIPYLERLGQNKILKGTISVTFYYMGDNPTDTLRYDFYLKDRALNESNLESTAEIILSENKIYIKE